MVPEMPFDDSERGVSPVVGVILMVAITVILAAVIGTFVLDLGSNVQQNAQAGVDISQSPDNSGTADANVSVNVVTMSNADYINVTGPSGASLDCPTTVVGNTCTEVKQVGATVGVNQINTGDTVTVIASLDGKDSVIQTYEVK